MKRDILERALAGSRFVDLDIVDSHCHLGPWYNYYFPEAWVDDMIRDADRVGVKVMCIAPHAAISCDYRLGNRQAANAAAGNPGRVKGLLTLNPNKKDEIMDEFDAYYSKDEFVGVKLHPTLHRYSLTDEGCLAVFEKIRECGGYVLSHTWEGSPGCSIDMCEKLLISYPEVALVLGHSGGTHKGVCKSIGLVNKYENAYMDTSGFEFSDIWIEEIMDKAERTKILFGSDCPFHDIRSGISRILFADMDDGMKEGILGGNFRNMILKYPKNSINT
jgi:uncharacterized protein